MRKFGKILLMLMIPLAIILFACAKSDLTNLTSKKTHTTTTSKIETTNTSTSKTTTNKTTTKRTTIKTTIKKTTTKKVTTTAHKHNLNKEYSSEKVISTCSSCGEIIEETINYSLDLDYVLSDSNDYYIINGLGECASPYIKIPNTYNDLPVKEISSDVFYNNEYIEAFIMENNTELSVVGDNFLNECINLAYISIEGTNNLTKIGKNFIKNTCIYNDTNNWIDGVFYYNNYLLDSNKELEGLYYIKEGTKTIADYALYENTELTGIVIPSSVEYIGQYSIANNSKLEKVYIIDKDNINNISYTAFDNIGSYIYREHLTGGFITASDNIIVLINYVRKDNVLFIIRQGATIIYQSDVSFSYFMFIDNGVKINFDLKGSSNAAKFEYKRIPIADISELED